MSSLKVFNVADKKFKFVDEPRVGTRMGYTSQILRKYNSISSTGMTEGGNARFEMSSADGFIDSVVYLEAKIIANLRFNANVTAAQLEGELKDKFGMNSFPINRCISNATVSFNDSKQFSTAVADNMDFFINSADTALLSKLSPASRLNSELVNTEANISNALKSGFNTDDAIKTRGIYSNYDIVITRVNDTNATVTITIKEALLANPFQFHAHEPNPFFGVDSLVVDLTYGTDLPQKLFEVAQESKIDLITLNANPDVKMVVHQFTPNVQLYSNKFPSRVFYNAPIIRSLKDSSIAVNAGAEREVNFKNHNLTGIPSLIGVACKLPKTALKRGEAFMPIQKISVNFGNKDQLLSDMTTKRDLYELASKNGYNGRFFTFAGEGASAGGILYFRPSDLGLTGPEMQSNSNSVLNFSITATFKNQTSTAVNVTPTIYIVYDNILKYEDRQVSDSLIKLSPADIVNGKLVYSNLDESENAIVGGSFWSKALDWLKSDTAKAISSFARNNIPIVKDYAGDTTAIGKFAKKAGYGKKGGNVNHLGGKKMSKKELMALLDN